MGLVDLSNFYLNSNAIMQGQRGASSETQAQTAVAEPASSAPAAGQSGGIFGDNMFSIILLYAAILGGFYFLSIRPQRKRQKLVQEMQSAIKAGDDVVTSNGFFGKVVDVTEEAFIIEFGTNKGVRVPVRKNDVFAAKTGTK